LTGLSSYASTVVSGDRRLNAQNGPGRHGLLPTMVFAHHDDAETACVGVDDVSTAVNVTVFVPTGKSSRKLANSSSWRRRNYLWLLQCETHDCIGETGSQIGDDVSGMGRLLAVSCPRR